MRSILAVKTSWLVAFMHEAAVTALRLAPKHSKIEGWNLYPAGIPIGLRDDPLMRAGFNPQIAPLPPFTDEAVLGCLFAEQVMAVILL